MSQPTIGYYTSYDPIGKTPELLHQMQSKWGSQLESLTYEQKIVMRAALAGYIANKSVWITENNDTDCIDCCIEGAGVAWDIWNQDETLVLVIQHCARLLSESDIEGLIAALTEQIISNTYASRLEEWEVVESY